MMVAFEHSSSSSLTNTTNNIRTFDIRNKRKVLHPCSSNWKLRRCDRRDWSGLPRNVLFDIMDKLNVIDDYVRFGAVCRTWRAIFLGENPENINKHCAQPFLLIPEAAPTGLKGVLYSLSTKKVYTKFHLRLPVNKYFQGSSFGWLVSYEMKSAHSHQVQLLNPFLSKDYVIHLPPPDDLERQHVDPDDAGRWHVFYLHKAVLSSDPSLSDDFVVMAIMSCYQGLAFCKPGDASWTSIGNWVERRRNLKFHDVIFYSKAKQFYGLCYSGEVAAIDFGVSKETKQQPKLVHIMPPVSHLDRAVKAYLVEDLSGQLLAISKVSGPGNGPRPYVLTVFKLDLAERKWIKVHNLGNTVLFLGKNGSIARSLSDCPGCQPNCIYFTEDVASFVPRCQHYAPPDCGVYCLDDGITRPHYYQPTMSKQVLPTPIWLEPTLLPTLSTEDYYMKIFNRILFMELKFLADLDWKIAFNGVMWIHLIRAELPYSPHCVSGHLTSCQLPVLSVQVMGMERPGLSMPCIGLGYEHVLAFFH